MNLIRKKKSNHMKITEGPQPVFVVGCSRSGTTLVQSILSTSPDLAAFPETNILYQVVGDLNYRRYGAVVTRLGRRHIPRMLLCRILNRAGIATNFVWSHESHNIPDSLKPYAPVNKENHELWIRNVFSDFQNMMTSASGGRRWVEKSPQNVFIVELIEKYIPDALFVHTRPDRERL